jgi:hypothetical protein
MVIQTKKLDMKEYKEKLIEQQGFLCPWTSEYIEPSNVEILYLNGMDFAISHHGLNQLRDDPKWGKVYINNKIVHSIDISGGRFIRDMG